MLSAAKSLPMEWVLLSVASTRAWGKGERQHVPNVVGIVGSAKEHLDTTVSVMVQMHWQGRPC